MRARLIRFLRWALAKLVPVDALVERALELVRAQEAIPDRSGEARRHQVYARLIKDFPDQRKRDLALAIEQAIQRL